VSVREAHHGVVQAAHLVEKVEVLLYSELDDAIGCCGIRRMVLGDGDLLRWAINGPSGRSEDHFPHPGFGAGFEELESIYDVGAYVVEARLRMLARYQKPEACSC
jgi:hypothetical protein